MDKKEKSKILEQIEKKAINAGFFPEFSVYNLRAGFTQCPACEEQVFIENFSRKDEIIFACVCGYRQRL